MTISDADRRLIEAALSAMEHSYSPYSGFKVGAAVRTPDGKTYAACNVENASYGLTVCAERAAVFKMISEGGTKIEALALVSRNDDPITPCGACRQIINEFAAADCRIICYSKNQTRIYRIDELLPDSFKSSDLT
jgi:cytidine deaminase